MQVHRPIVGESAGSGLGVRRVLSFHFKNSFSVIGAAGASKYNGKTFNPKHMNPGFSSYDHDYGDSSLTQSRELHCYEAFIRTETRQKCWEAWLSRLSRLSSGKRRGL
jgi:hypothetical protein